MLRHRVFQIAILVSTGLAANATSARAQGPAGPGCAGGACATGGYGGGCGAGGCTGFPRYGSLASALCGGKGAPLPTFQAAPWYLYWPYDGHFLTPAPVTGAFYGPPVPGNFPVNPYFPGPGYGYGAGYGPIPGGAAPLPPGYPGSAMPGYGYGPPAAPGYGYGPPGAAMPGTVPQPPAPLLPPTALPPKQ